MYHSFRAIVDGQKINLVETNLLEGKYEAIVTLTAPLNTRADLHTDLPISRYQNQVSQMENVSNSKYPVKTESALDFLPGTRQVGTYTDRASNSTISVKDAQVITPVALINDTLSQLYHEKTKREARRSSSVGDIYVDVSIDSYQRLMQGDQVSLIFEESGSYSNSPFIIIENGSQLCLNFYQFNEGKYVSQDKLKILSQIFEIKGNLPDFVKICKPAQVVSKNGGYVVVKKGILLLDGVGK